MNYEEMYGNPGDDTLVFMGGAVKRIEGYKVGGYGVLFTSPKDPDTSLEYFDKTTDFDFEAGEKRSGYYSHGFDETIGNSKVGRASMTTDEVGVWLEGQVDQRHKYADAIMTMVDKGELGYSTGAVAHLCRRKAVSGKSNIAHITHWPIGEWSLTPSPAEPRTLAVPLKTWAKSLKGVALGENAEASATIAAVSDLTQTLMSNLYSVLYGWDTYEGAEPTAEEQIAQVTPMLDEWRDIALRIVTALITDEEVSEEGKSLLFSLTRRSNVKTPADFCKLLRKAGFSRKEATAITGHGFNSLRNAGEPENLSDTFRGESLRELARIELQQLRLAGVAL